MARNDHALEPNDRPWLGGWYLFLPIVALSWSRELWAPDEPRYAQIAKEAWERGSFLVLHLCGELYPDKPPLVYWAAGLCGRLTGWSEFAMRAPSLLATAGSAWITARLARRFLGELEAAWSVVFFLGTVMMLEIGGRLQLDPVLTFFCLAALDAASNAAGDERARTRRALVAGICTGLGALAKGPPAWTHVGFALVAWSCLPRTLRLRPSWPARAWIGFVVLSLAPVGIWAGLAVLREPALIEPLFFGQHIGRITQGDKHPGPIWSHLARMPLLLLPWTLLVVAGLARAARAWRAKDDAEAGLVRGAAWLALVFAFFSVIPPKRDLYLLPIYPAAALLGAREFAHALRRGALAGWIGYPSAAIAFAAGLGVVIAPFLSGIVPPDVGVHAWAIAPTGFVLCVAACFAFDAQRRGRVARWANALGIGVAASAGTVALVLVPSVNDAKSGRELALILHARPERPSQIPCVGVRPEGIRFYGDVPATAGDLVQTLEVERSQFLGLCADLNFERLSPEDRARFVILATRRRGMRDVFVLGAKSP